MKSITCICPTIGRISLEITIRSWIYQERMPEDRLVIIGDGWYGDWIEELIQLDPGIRFISRFPKLGNFGHPQINWLLDSGDITSDYVWTMNDDDAYLPWSFTTVRPLLKGENMVAGIGIDDKGDVGRPIIKKVHPKIAGVRPLIPNPPTYRLGKSDGNWFREEAKEREVVLCPIPCLFVFAPLSSEEVWKDLKMDRIMEWRKEFNSCREPKRFPTVGNEENWITYLVRNKLEIKELL